MSGLIALGVAAVGWGTELFAAFGWGTELFK
jgi:hypothetical protein